MGTRRPLSTWGGGGVGDVSTRVSPVELVEVCCAWRAQQAPTGTHNCSDGELPCATHCPEGQGATGVLPFQAGTLCLVARGLSPGETRPFCGRPARDAASAIHRSGPSCCAHLMTTGWLHRFWGESLCRLISNSQGILERRHSPTALPLQRHSSIQSDAWQMAFWCTGGRIRGRQIVVHVKCPVMDFRNLLENIIFIRHGSIVHGGEPASSTKAGTQL